MLSAPRMERTSRRQRRSRNRNRCPRRSLQPNRRKLRSSSNRSSHSINNNHNSPMPPTLEWAIPACRCQGWATQGCRCQGIRCSIPGCQVVNLRCKVTQACRCQECRILRCRNSLNQGPRLEQRNDQQGRRRHRIPRRLPSRPLRSRPLPRRQILRPRPLPPPTICRWDRSMISTSNNATGNLPRRGLHSGTQDSAVFDRTSTACPTSMSPPRNGEGVLRERESPLRFS